MSARSLLSRADEMLDRFEQSEIPLWDTFGSSSESHVSNGQFIVAFGPGVEAGRLLEVLVLLDGFGVQRLHAMPQNRKSIYIGSLNLENEPTIPFSADLLEVIRDLPEKADQLGPRLLETSHRKLVT
jgi:hypothetical protein